MTVLPEVERAVHGLRVRGHGLYLDPRGRPAMGFLAHARAARPVLPERTVATAATVALLSAAQPRALRKAAPLPASYGSPFALGSLKLTLHPAGHVLGSAQLRCEAEGLDLVYAADLGGIGAHASSTAEPREQLECETLVLRATYGHPRYVFPPRQAALDEVQAFVERTLRGGDSPVLIANALGATQDLVRHLGPRHVLRLHPTALRACEVYQSQGVALGNYVRLQDEGEVVVVPPTVRTDRLAIPRMRTCLLSGHALDGKGIADEAVALSDHAGFDQLVDYASRSFATRIFVVHGHVEDLAAALRGKGREVHAIRDHHQLPLPGF